MKETLEEITAPAISRFGRVEIGLGGLWRIAAKQ